MSETRYFVEDMSTDSVALSWDGKVTWVWNSPMQAWVVSDSDAGELVFLGEMWADKVTHEEASKAVGHDLPDPSRVSQ